MGIDKDKYTPKHCIGNIERQYGVYSDEIDGIHIARVSVPNWDGFMASLKDVEYPDIIVTPELFLATDLILTEPENMREIIESRIESVRRGSFIFDGATFCIGTPYWVNGRDKPYNSIVFIKDGKILGFCPKKVSTSIGEYNAFTFPSQQNQFEPIGIPGYEDKIGVLICADLPFSKTSITEIDEITKRFYRKSGRLSLAEYDLMPDFLNPSWDTLIVPSMWGVAGNKSSLAASTPDNYYHEQMVRSMDNCFRIIDHVQHILVCDCCSPFGMETHATTPLNAYYMRTLTQG